MKRLLLLLTVAVVSLAFTSNVQAGQGKHHGKAHHAKHQAKHFAKHHAKHHGLRHA